MGCLMERGAGHVDTKSLQRAGLWLVAVLWVLCWITGAAYVPFDSAVLPAGKVVAANKNNSFSTSKAALVEDVACR